MPPQVFDKRPDLQKPDPNQATPVDAQRTRVLDEYERLHKDKRGGDANALWDTWTRSQKLAKEGIPEGEGMMGVGFEGAERSARGADISQDRYQGQKQALGKD